MQALVDDGVLQIQGRGHLDLGTDAEVQVLIGKDPDDQAVAAEAEAVDQDLILLVIDPIQT